MVPVAEGSRTADPRPSPRGDSAGPGRSDVGARAERAREPPGAVHGRRPGPLSNGARADVPGRGKRPSQGHEEGPIQDQAAAPAGGLGASVSETTGDLAFLQVVEKLLSPYLESMTFHRARISAPARVTSWLVYPIDGPHCLREISAMPYDWLK